MHARQVDRGNSDKAVVHERCSNRFGRQPVAG